MVTPTRILLTGFEPFGLLKENPSQILAEALSTLEWESVEIRCLVLPVDFRAATESVANFYRQDWMPDIVLHFGVAKSRDTLTLERFALNMMDSVNGDNAGYVPDEVPIKIGAPLAYQTTIPCKQIIQHLASRGYDVKLSNSAGTYVCNAVLFTSLHLLSTISCFTPFCSANNVKCGFIHLPLFEKVGKPVQFTIVKTIIQWLVKNQQQVSQDYLFPGNAQ